MNLSVREISLFSKHNLQLIVVFENKKFEKILLRKKIIKREFAFHNIWKHCIQYSILTKLVPVCFEPFLDDLQIMISTFFNFLISVANQYERTVNGEEDYLSFKIQSAQVIDKNAK
jgi:hypothetical protein